MLTLQALAILGAPTLLGVLVMLDAARPGLLRRTCSSWRSWPVRNLPRRCRASWEQRSLRRAFRTVEKEELREQHRRLRSWVIGRQSERTTVLRVDLPQEREGADYVTMSDGAVLAIHPGRSIPALALRGALRHGHEPILTMVDERKHGWVFTWRFGEHTTESSPKRMSVLLPHGANDDHRRR